MFYKTDVLLGSAYGGGAAGAYYGSEGNQAEQNMAEGAAWGVFATGAVGSAAYLEYKTGLLRKTNRLLGKPAIFFGRQAAKAGWKVGSSMTSNVAGWFAGSARDYFRSMPREYRAIRASALAAGGSEAAASLKGARAFFRPMVLGGLGAAAGAYLSEDRYLGATVGGAAGLLAGGLLKYSGAISKIRKVPGSGLLGVLAATAAAGAAGALLSEPEVQSAATGVDDGAGGVAYAPYNGSIRTRMENMAAKGDLVFGLHNRRHG